MGSASKDLLEIEPLELRFPFEIKKQISCSMQLKNRTNDYIGFKVKSTSPNKYCVRPSSGIVPPLSTCDVIVAMQAQKETPPDMQCKDKFVVQSVIVAEGTLVKYITENMFTKESGNVVDEVKLKVVYVPPPKQPSPVREGSEEGSSPRTSLSDGSKLNYQAIKGGTTSLSPTNAPPTKRLKSTVATLSPLVPTRSFGLKMVLSPNLMSPMVILSPQRTASSKLQSPISHFLKRRTAAAGPMDMELGFRFHPTNMEIVHYLKCKRDDRTFTCAAMGDLDVYKLEPWNIPCQVKFSRPGDEMWWFFNHPKKGKGKSGASRTTPTGYWKASGKNLEIHDTTATQVASRKSLVFYLGRVGSKQPTGKKTGWVMHEYSLCDNPASPTEDPWVVCSVFEKEKDGDGQSSLVGGALKAAGSILDMNDDMQMPVDTAAKGAASPDLGNMLMPEDDAAKGAASLDLGDWLADPDVCLTRFAEPNVCFSPEDAITLDEMMNRDGLTLSQALNDAT